MHVQLYRCMSFTNGLQRLVQTGISGTFALLLSSAAMFIKLMMELMTNVLFINMFIHVLLY